MKTIFRLGLLIAASGMAAAPAVAGEVGDLTAFTAGSPARAAEVNGNFNALKTAVNGSAADIAALQASVANQQTALAELVAGVNALNGSVTALASNVASVSGDVSALQAALPTTAFAFGAGAAPQNADSTPRFVGVTTTVSVAAGETLVVTSHFVPYWQATNAGQTSNFVFTTCLRQAGSGADPSPYGAFSTGALADRTGVGFSSAYVFTTLNAGTYEVGMCGYGSTILVGDWFSSGSRVVAQIFRNP